MKKMLFILFGGAMLLAAGMASSCELAGWNKHIGPVVAVDDSAGEFAIRDAATGREIRFSASSELLALLRTERIVKVRYRENADGRLETVALQAI